MCLWHSWLGQGWEAELDVVLSSLLRDPSLLADDRVKLACEPSLNGVSENEKIDDLVINGGFLNRQCASTKGLLLEIAIRLLFCEQLLEFFDSSLKS